MKFQGASVFRRTNVSLLSVKQTKTKKCDKQKISFFLKLLYLYFFKYEVDLKKRKNVK